MSVLYGLADVMRGTYPTNVPAIYDISTEVQWQYLAAIQRNAWRESRTPTTSDGTPIVTVANVFEWHEKRDAEWKSPVSELIGAD